MKYRVTTLSPIHIGSGRQLTPFEFALDGDRFLVAKLEKILEARPDRADELNRRLDRDGRNFSLSDFLRAGEKQYPAFRKYSAVLAAHTRELLERDRLQGGNMDVAECLKTSGDAQLYLPGSSLKGAFRTALAYTAFHDDERLFASLKRLLATLDRRHSTQTVDELIFRGAGNNPAYDLFKALCISDSSILPANEHNLEIGASKILSLKTPEQAAPPEGSMYAQLKALNLAASAQSPLKQDWTILETVRPGVRFEVEIALDETLLHTDAARRRLGWIRPCLPELSPKTLLRAANRFAAAVCEWELQFFGRQVSGIDAGPVLDFYQGLRTKIENSEGQSCYLCLGYGAGWHKQTIGILLERAADFDFRGLRKKLRLAPERLQFDFPKSRKLFMAAEEKIQAVFGWSELRIIFP